ncbi:putative transcription factor & chromatin remodeling ARID family [Helianthus debilis subsp. tardiflorus]
MMEDGEFVFKYYEIKDFVCVHVGDFRCKFGGSIKLGITTRPIPPYASDKRKVDLLGLYMVVKRDGGYRNVTDYNLWPVVAKDMGYEYHNGEFMRITYAMYLDVLVYYYKFKTVQERVIDKEVIKVGDGSSDSRQERRKSVGDVRDGEAMQHYALFAGNDLEGAIKMQKKRQKFDFKQAMKSMDEANQSVLMYASKHNQV